MSLFDLIGKTALITGAAGGLGSQFARTLSAAGARVLLTNIREDALKDLASTLAYSYTLKMDVTNQASVTEAFQLFNKNNEKIDICVNNAGTVKLTPLFQDEFDHDAYDSFDKSGLEV